MSWRARTQLPVHLPPHLHLAFNFKWTVNVVPQAEEGHPGGMAKWTVKFSCVLSLPLVQNNLYVTDFFLLKPC